MKPIHAAILLAAALLVPALSQKGGSPFAGRWDLTMTLPNGTTYPDWLEVVEQEGGLKARFQPRGGSVRPFQSAQMAGDHLILTMPSGGKPPAVAWDLTVQGDRITGSQKRGENAMFQIAGVRAPVLDRRPPKSWTKPESLFNGKDLTGWEPVDNPNNNHWVARDGVLLNESKGANLRTTRKFDDLKLHVEFNCPEGGNSGIYLRGRYEIQVEYEPAGSEDPFHSMGSIYGMVAPTVTLPRKPGEWESFDVTFVGRRVTIVRNGTKTVDNQEIAGITGGALDSNEGEAGPFYLQGDHTGGMKYRNMTIAVPKK